MGTDFEEMKMPNHGGLACQGEGKGSRHTEVSETAAATARAGVAGMTETRAPCTALP